MSSPKLTTTHWLIITIASIGFLFDTYELLMTPLVAAPALAELLKLPISNPVVTDWVGKLLWIAALCGGVFGLLGGYLVDKFGRKTVMAGSIFLYSAAPFCAAYHVRAVP
jgi:MFS family permease